MSHTEHHIGKAIKVDNPNNKSAELQAIAVLISKGINISNMPSYHNDYMEWLKDAFHEEYFYHKKTNTLYKLDDKELEEDGDDIIKAKYNDDGTINYEVKFYNGGVGLDECIEEAFDELPNPPQSKPIEETYSWNEVEEFMREAFYKGREVKKTNDRGVVFSKATFNEYLREIINNIGENE